MYVYNNSRIEHSIVGADTYQDDIYAADYPKPSYGGGIVRTNNATLFNNRIDVRITNYTHPPSAGVPVENQSTFMNTSFITNGIHNDPSLPPLSHAFLLNAGGIKFTGCTFENQTPNLYAELNRGRGIHNVNNKLTVIPGCSIPTVGCIPNDPCIFKDLASGVYSNSGSTLISTFVEGNQFINNFYGVYLGGLTGSIVQRNQFEVLNSQNPNIVYNQTAGVFLNACTGYIITENFFTQTDGATALTNSRGVVVQNSGESHNEIYKNTFDNILVGGQSQSINGVNIDVTNPNNAEPVGLQWLCNDFQENIDVDLYVSSGRIDYQQGYYGSAITSTSSF
ncbi:MAG: hypothetical protein IPH24_00225 [Crocinitomicaceae bacterium]|nr:hypothetical protein [Crocinitomicaceae bacterium]